MVRENCLSLRCFFRNAYCLADIRQTNMRADIILCRSDLGRTNLQAVRSRWTASNAKTTDKDLCEPRRSGRMDVCSMSVIFADKNTADMVSRIPPCPGHALVCSLLSDLHPPQSEQTAPRSIASRNVRETMSAVGYRIYKNRDPRLRISVLGRSIQASA